MSFLISEILIDDFIDTKNLVFSWKLTSSKKNVFQISYKIEVFRKDDNFLMWNSGEVESEKSNGIEYKGKEFSPTTEYFVKICVKNNFGEYAQSQKKFETTFLCDDFSCWNGAKFIGAPEYYVCSEAIGVFSLESEIKISNFGKAGIIFGADDYRLQNKELNEMLIEGENYCLICVNKKNNNIEVFRVGASKDDKKSLPLKIFNLPKENENFSYKLKLDVTGNCVNINLNNVFIGKVQLNPLGDNDVTTFPHLGNIGYYAESFTKAHFSGIKCKFIREPSNIFYECDTENGIDIFSQEETFLKRNPNKHAIPMLRRNFFVQDKIKKARLYVTARGIYECRINGKSVSDEYFSPGASQFDKHLYYQTYDVTNLLNNGENGIGFTLSSGWWNGSQTFVLGCYNFWGDKESVMAKLVVSYENGSSQSFVTNTQDWFYYGEGAYKFAGFFQGERVDGRELLEYYNFSKPDFKNDNLKRPLEINPSIISEYDSLPGFFRKYPKINKTVPKLVGKSHCPVFQVEELNAKKILSPAENVFIYDLEQEIAGTVKITFNGEKGETAIIRYAEMLYPKLEEYGQLTGRLLVANLRDAASTDKYILNGDKDEIYSPRFTFHGFRYIEISGIKNPPKISEVKGIQLSSVQKFSGTIKTDNELLNRFVKNVKYSQLCNFISIPTDCPQRNERMGWAGDTHVFCKTANLNSNVKNFYLRYLEALRDCQEENGNLPEIAPVGGGFGGITYGSALSFIVNDLYDFYADKSIIIENYSAMKKYMIYLSNFNLPGNAYLGPIDDWLAFEKTDSNLVWNAFYGRLCFLMLKFSKILNLSDDVILFKKKLEDAKLFFEKTFFDSKKGLTLNLDGTINDSMGSYAISLAFGMLSDENILKAQKRLSKKVQQSKYKITTGFFCTGLVNPMLSEGGFVSDSYKMITQTEFPSWLYPVTQGATTIWERWNSYTHEKGFNGMNSMNSFNHYSLGSVLSWLYEYGLGIRHEKDVAGWKEFIIKPDFSFKQINGGFETPYGRIEVSYEIFDKNVKFSCTIPANSKAKIFLPNRVEILGSGTYFYDFLLNK